MKNNVNEITKLDFRDTLELVWNGKINSIAPLGYSSAHHYLYNNPTPRDDGNGFKAWSGCVTMRTHSDMPEMLIGNKAGNWLCHLKIDRLMGFEYVLDEFHRQFENVKHLIDGFHSKEHELEVSKDVKYSSGFRILELAQSAIGSTKPLNEVVAEGGISLE